MLKRQTACSASTLLFPEEMRGTGGGTNPEQLFAAGYAACFGSVLQYVAANDKVALQSTSVTATVALAPNGQGGFRLRVRLKIEFDGVEHEHAEALAAAAHRICPYSNALRGDAYVALEVRTMSATT